MTDKLSRQARLHAQIVGHGEALKEIFGLDISAYELCKRLRRIENKGHRLAEQYCNGEIDAEVFEDGKYKCLRQVDLLLEHTKKGIPVFFNGDPRGGCLKIREDFVCTVRIYRDFGGYILLAPNFDGN